MELKKNYSVERTYEQFFTGGKVEISQDGQYMFSTCESSVKIIELSNMKPLHTFEEDEDSFTCFSVGGDVLVIAWRSLLLKQYNWKEGTLVRQWKGHIGPVMAMDFDHTFTLLATGSTDGIIKIWDCDKQYCTHNFKDLSGVVSLVQFHPTQLLLFSSSLDRRIKIWDLTSSSCKHILDGHVSVLTSLAVSNDGKLLVSGGRDKVIILWNISKGKRVKTIPIYESIEGVVTVPSTATDELQVVTAGSKGVITGWDVNTGRQLGTASPLSADIEYTDLQFCRKLNCLVGVASDHNITFYDVGDHNVLKHFVSDLDEILDIKCTNKYIVTATNSEQIKLFDHKEGSCVVLTGHSDTVMSLDVSVDGGMLVSGSKDNSVRIWKLVDGIYTCCGEGRGHTLSVGAVACARLRPLVPFIVSGSQDHTIKLWNIGTIDQEWNMEDDIARLSVSCTQIAHTKDINSLDVSPNNKLIVSGSQDKTAKIWNVDGLSLYGTLLGHKRGLWSVQFSHVDQCVLTSSADATIRLWSITDLNCLKTFEGHNTSVLKAIFIHRGMQFVSADNNGIIKLWNIKSQECVCTLDHHTDRIWALSSTNDGERVYSGGADSLICQWKDITEEIEAEQQAMQDQIIMKEQDLMNYMHKKDFVRAVSVALSLDQPYKVLSLLKEMLDEEGLEGKFKTTILLLTNDDKKTLLTLVAKWNTNSKHCRVAQSVLHVILKTTPPEELIKFDGLNELLKGLIPYTERHFQRLSKLKQLAMFVDYTWQCMKLPEELVTSDINDTLPPPPIN